MPRTHGQIGGQWAEGAKGLAELAGPPLSPPRPPQTVCCGTLSSLEWLWVQPLQYEREELTAHDGNPVYLDWAVFPDDDPRGGSYREDWPVLVIVHGLGGGRDEPYVRRMTMHAHKRGWRPVGPWLGPPRATPPHTTPAARPPTLDQSTPIGAWTLGSRKT